MTKIIERIFTPLDATVVHVNKPLSVEQLDEAFGELEYDMRYYKTDDGWEVRFCYDDVGSLDFMDNIDVSLETGAWDHEDCQSCDKEIREGDIFYTIHKDDDTTSLYCKSCRSKQNET